MLVKMRTLGMTFALILGASPILVGHAEEQFIPQGHVYGPNSEQLPALNSEQDQIDAAADVRETEIWKQQYQKRVFNESLIRFDDHDFSTPNSLYSKW